MYGVLLCKTLVGGKEGGLQKFWELRRKVYLPFVPFRGLCLSRSSEGGTEYIDIPVSEDISIIWDLEDEVFEVHWKEYDEDLEEAESTAVFSSECDGWKLYNKWESKGGDTLEKTARGDWDH